MSTHTFGVTEADPFAIAGDNLTILTLGRPSSSQFSVGEDNNGEYVEASAGAHGEIQTIEATYGPKLRGAIATFNVAAGAAAELAVQGVSVNTTKGALCEVRANGHKHIGGTNSDHNATVRNLIVPAFRGFGASDFGLGIGLAPAHLQSGSYAIALEHDDEEDADGNFLCGTGHKERHTASFEAVDPGAWTIPTGWTEVDGNPDPDLASSKAERVRLTITKVVGFTPAV